MGHQESLMFCDTKKDMIRLCKLLNKVAADPSENGLEYAGLDIYEVARLKQDVTAQLPWQERGPIFPKGCYFIWWGGERYPQEDDDFLFAHTTKLLYPYWNTIFVEYIVPQAAELLRGIEKGRPGDLQENDWIRTFHPDKDNRISLELTGLSRQTRRHRPMARAALFSTKTIYIRIVPKLLTNTWFRAIIISNQSE